jgi:hypothetical protein
MKLPSASSTRNRSCILQEEAYEALNFQRNLPCNPTKKKKKKDIPFLTNQTKKILCKDQIGGRKKKQISNKKRRKT